MYEYMNKISDYIVKHSNKDSDNLKYDFMPEILEIIERPANKSGVIIIFSVFALMLAVILWSVIAKTDIVITAQGRVTPEGDIISVQAYAAGKVETVDVAEGQHVEKGELLIEMDSINQQTDISNLQSEILVLNDQADVYEKIISGISIDEISPEQYNDKSKNSITAIIEAENEYRQSLEILDNSLKSAELEYSEAVNKRTKYEGDDQYKDVLESQKKVEQQKQIEKNNAQLNIDNYRSQHISSLNNSYAEIKNTLLELSSQLKKISAANDYNKIYSPVAGYVNKMSVHTKGDIVNTYEEVLTILPSDVSLQMKAYVDNKDIANIHMGSEVRVKLDAYPYSDYGVVNGKVISISPDIYTIENVGNVYQIIVELEDNEKIDVISGLTGTVEIKIGERSIISYFLDPLINGVDNMFKEK